ncbi:MAG TPA: MFS transporter [Dehalococcoidia bacterium]|nr:MFS transporter [Dehalococcoidia bacterium]
MRSAISLLRGRNFGLLFSGRCVSFLGNAMAPVALAFAVLHISDSPSALGIVLAARMLPNVLFLLVGGVIADRLPRSTVLVGANLTGGVAQAVAGVLLVSGRAEVWQLVVLEAVNGAAFAIFYPADTSVVPLTVAEDRLQEANALLRLGTNATMILGAALAGVVVAAINPGTAILVDAATFFAAAALLSLMRGIEAAAPAGASVLADLRTGWSEFIAHRWLWTIVAQFTVMLLGFFGAFMVLGPVVAERELTGATAWAAILGGQSAGLLAGGLVAMRWRPAHPLFVATIAVFGNALPIAALALGLPLPLIVAAALVNGAGMELFGVYWYTALHEHVAPEALARVSAYDALGSICATPVGLIASGPLADLIGIDATLWIGVALIVVPTALVLLVPEVRSLRSRAGGPLLVAA